MVGRTKHHTQADKERAEIIVELHCIACAVEGWADVPCEVHHLLNESGQRFEDEHRYTIGLCPWHHQGRVTHGFSGDVDAMTRSHGPSFALDARAFHARYGTDEQLLVIQDSMIRIVQAAYRRGEFLDPVHRARLIRMTWKEVVLRQPPTYMEVARG